MIVSDVLVKVQDEEGKAVEQLSIGWINEIGEMSVTEGYKLRVTEGTSLNITGTPVPLPFSIPLETGWNVIGCPSVNPQSSSAAFESLISSGVLLKVQDELGAAIERIEGSWIYGFENLVPGEGYRVKTNADVTLTITGAAKGETLAEEMVKRETNHFRPVYTGNGLDHMNIYIGRGEWEKGRMGDEIGVFDGPICVGAVLVEEGEGKYVQLTASFDDPVTEAADGFTEGHSFEIRLWDSKTGMERKTQTMEPAKEYDKIFERLGTSVLKVNFGGAPDSFLGDAYPNPSADRTTFSFQLVGESKVRLEIFDVTGDLVMILVNEAMQEGSYSVEWDNHTSAGNKAKAGMYFYKLSLNGLLQVKSLIIR